MATPLAEKMRALADQGHARADELRASADAFDAATDAEPFSAKKLLGAWARARRVWCDCTGESLV